MLNRDIQVKIDFRFKEITNYLEGAKRIEDKCPEEYRHLLILKFPVLEGFLKMILLLSRKNDSVDGLCDSLTQVTIDYNLTHLKIKNDMDMTFAKVISDIRNIEEHFGNKIGIRPTMDKTDLINANDLFTDLILLLQEKFSTRYIPEYERIVKEI